MQIAKSQSAYEYIKEIILTGELSPRIDISEKQLQQELGISRTPVHEALKRLQDEGFVETYARKGTFVADVTIETVQDIYETRLLIEPFMTKNAVGLVPKDWMEDLRRRLQACAETSAALDAEMQNIYREINGGQDFSKNTCADDDFQA